MSKARKLLEALKDFESPDGTGPHGRGSGPGKGQQKCNYASGDKIRVTDEIKDMDGKDITKGEHNVIERRENSVLISPSRGGKLRFKLPIDKIDSTEKMEN